MRKQLKCSVIGDGFYVSGKEDAHCIGEFKIEKPSVYPKANSDLFTKNGQTINGVKCRCGIKMGIVMIAPPECIGFLCGSCGSFVKTDFEVSRVTASFTRDPSLPGYIFDHCERKST